MDGLCDSGEYGLNLGVGHCPLHHHTLSTELALTVQRVYLAGEPSQEYRLLDRGIASLTTATSMSWKKAQSQIAQKVTLLDEHYRLGSVDIGALGQPQTLSGNCRQV